MSVSSTVSLVVINYNGIEWIGDCLNSIFLQSRAPQEVLVVDNASIDGSPDIVRNGWPTVKLLELPRNIGFAAACNRGVAATTGDLVAILNNDIVLDADWLSSLLSHDVAPWDFWASRIVFAADASRLDSAGDGMGVVGAAFKHGHGLEKSDFGENREVFGPCAAAALYRRSLLDSLGGFDEDYFLIYEDADLSMRARLRGHRCLYVAAAEVVHRVNSSIGTISSTYVYYGHRNSEYLFWKNMPTPLLILYLPERLLFNGLSLGYFLLKGRGLDFLRSKLDFLRNLGAVLRKRRKVQSHNRLGSRQFNRILTRNWFKGRRNISV